MTAEYAQLYWSTLIGYECKQAIILGHGNPSPIFCLFWGNYKGALL